MRIMFKALVALIALTSAAQAGDIAVHAGQFSSLRNNANKSAMAGVEYRFNNQFNGIRPTVGVMGNTDGMSYEYAGITWDLPLNTGRFQISPGIAAGYYNKGDSKALGYDLEFRSVMEVTYKFKDGQRFGAQISHLSNAGLGSSNPGTEMIEAVYTHPLY